MPQAIDKLANKLIFPTPHLPDVIAIIRVLLCEFSLLLANNFTPLMSLMSVYKKSAYYPRPLR